MEQTDIQGSVFFTTKSTISSLILNKTRFRNGKDRQSRERFTTKSTIFSFDLDLFCIPTVVGRNSFLRRLPADPFTVPQQSRVPNLGAKQPATEMK